MKIYTLSECLGSDALNTLHGSLVLTMYILRESKGMKLSTLSERLGSETLYTLREPKEVKKYNTVSPRADLENINS